MEPSTDPGVNLEQTGEEAEVLLEEGGRVIVHEGVRIFIHKDSEVALKGSGRWIITIPEGCTDKDIKAMAEHMPEGSTPSYSGTPDEGGICVFMMIGTEQMVKEELSTHHWPSKPH